MYLISKMKKKKILCHAELFKRSNILVDFSLLFSLEECA